MARYVKMLATAAGPDGILHAGQIYRLDNAKADALLKSGLTIGGRTFPACELVTDPASLKKARPIDRAVESDNISQDDD